MIDAATGIREKQRIIKLTQYPQDHTKDECELANKLPSFEEAREKLQAAQEIINTVISDDGRYTGTINVSDILHFEEGVSGSGAVGNLQGLYNALNGDLSELKVSVGQIETNYIKAEDADLKYATIKKLEVEQEKVKNLDADYGNIKNLLSGAAGIGDLSTIVITTKNATIENEVVRNSVMESVYVADLLAGDISTNRFRIVSDDGGVCIDGSTQQLRDKDGTVRIQIGRDKNNDFTFSLFDETGNGVLIDHTGIKPGAVADGLIVDDMVNDNANINAEKLDIKSLFTAINGSEEVIKSNRVWLDGEKQTLNQVYESLKNNVDDMIGNITEIKTGIEGLGVSITETKSEVAGVRKNGLLYNVTYHTNEDGTTTLTATVYKDGKDATKEYPERWFSWRKKTESEETFLGYGYTITVNNDDYEFGGVVVGRFSTYRNVLPAVAQGILAMGGKTLRISTEI